MQQMGLIPQSQSFDVNGYLSAFRQGEHDLLARTQRENRANMGRIANDQGYLAAFREAMSVGDMDWAARFQAMDTQQQQRFSDTLGRLASAADTPERWNTLIAQMRTRFGAESIRGFEDFSSRPAAIRVSMTASENLAEQHRRAMLAEQRRMHDAQITHMRAQDRRLDDRSALDMENVELRRRQLDAQNLSRDRGFTLQSLTSLARARTPEEFQLVAQTLRPFLGRVPNFNERDRLVQSAMDSLEEFDVVPDENGRPSRVSRGWSPMVLAALGPAGVGAPGGQAQPQPAPAQPRPVNPTAIMDAAAALTPVLARDNARLNLPGVPRMDLAPNAALQGVPNTALDGLLPGSVPAAQPPQQAQPGIPLQAPAARPAPGISAQRPPLGGPGGGGFPVVPVAAPGGMAVGGAPSGGVVPVQGTQGGGAPDGGQRGYRGPIGARREIVEEIETNYGAPSTWGQNGVAMPPHSVIQRYWQSVNGSSGTIRGRQYTADGQSVPIQQRGGDGGATGNSASSNARRLIPEILNQLDVVGAYLQSTSIPGQVIDNTGGPLSQWAGGGRFTQAQASYGEATRVIMHALSGAQTARQEFDHYVQMFTPQAWDSAEVRLLKHNRIAGALRTLQGVTEDFTDANLAEFRRYLRQNLQNYYGVNADDLARFRGRGGQTPPGAQGGGGAPAPAGGGWGGAGGMSTQDIIRNMR
jgi:hypothetical protein